MGSKVRSSVFELAAISFLLVGGGPVGIETAIQAAGPLWTLCALLVFPLVWALPQSLITAELSTMFDSNGGYILWSHRAFGSLGAWLMSFNSLLSNAVSLALFPILLSEYLTPVLPVSFVRSHDSRLIAVALWVAWIAFLNLHGTSVLSRLSFVLAVLTFTPYLLELLYLLAEGRLDTAPWILVQPAPNWQMFGNVLLWNYSGWDRLSCIAGDFADPQRTYPLALMMAVLVVAVNYFIPIAVAVSVDANFDAYHGGHILDVAGRIAPPFTGLVLMSAVIGMTGSFNAAMASNSRALWCVAKFRMLPAVFGELNGSATPYAAVMAHALITVFLSTMPFHDLVMYSNALFLFTIILELGCFWRLKALEPHAPRPFAVPGGRVGAFCAVVPVLVIALTVLTLSSSDALAFLMGYNAVLLIGYYLWSRAASSSGGAELKLDELRITKSSNEQLSDND